MLYIGGHYKCVYNYDDLLIAIDHCRKSGGNALQIFVGSNTSTTTSAKQKARLSPSEFKDIKNLLRDLDMKIYIHGSLSLNLCNPLKPRYEWSLINLLYDLNFGHQIGAKAVVIHLGTIVKDRFGNKMSNKEIEESAYENMAKSLEFIANNSPPKIKTLIETSAGQKNKIATRIEDLGRLWKMISAKARKRIGFCIDTCHIFSAGYPIDEKSGWKDYITLFNRYIGIKYVYLIHLNDSKAPFGSKKDLHTGLMDGYIFKKNGKQLGEIVRWIDRHHISMILETRSLADYKKEIRLVKEKIEK